MPPAKGKNVPSASIRPQREQRGARLRHARAPVQLVESLTARELEVLALMADGLFNREIGAHLSLAQETVKTHVHRVLTKLNARSRAHAVAIAIRRGLIE
jgi:DNA-binding NarL/FixJ family response regulator